MGTTWEYLKESSGKSISGYRLNKLGEVGWELVSATVNPGGVYVYIFKRKKVV